MKLHVEPIVVQDTREQAGKKNHILKAFEKHGIRYIRTKLYVGDWTLLHNQTVCIDTKTLGLQEVYSNLVQDHDRFRAECDKAMDVGIRLIVLVEEPDINTLDDVKTWVNPRMVEYEMKKKLGASVPKAAPISSERLYGIMRTMSELHGVEWAFTDREHCGETILRLLGVAIDA